jgi:hypothetical protein
MTTSSSPLKKQKLNVEDYVPQRIQNENVKSPVTAIASSIDSIIFSGHRDGTICRWTIDSVKDRHVLDWVISACINLTDHEIYGKEENLGIAGLAIRLSQIDSGKNVVATTEKSSILYSWNHQREDMRESNGIPQKVMLWNSVTGERRSALMIDVGRSDTGVFANPLVSCLVFCKLLVDQPPNQIKPKSFEEGGVSTHETLAIEKVWTDVIVVALQATCEEPNKDIDFSSDNMNDAIKPQRVLKPIVASGNILPFIEDTRQRLKPWSCVGGFVRALAVPDNSYILSVTETTRPSSLTQTDSAHVTSNSEEDEQTKSDSNKANKEIGGKAHSITLWDTSCPGVVLYRIKLCDMPNNEIPVDGNVYALTMSNTTLFLAIAQSDKNGCAVVIDLPDRHAEEKLNTMIALSTCGIFSLTPGIVTSHMSDSIALSQKVLCSDGDKVDKVHLYSLSDLRIALEDHESGTNFDLRKLQIKRLTLPNCAQITLTRISIGESNVIAGYGDGAIVMTRVQALNKDLTPSSKGSNEHVSCSMATIGLRGVLCPNLSSSASNVQLENKCLIM